MNKYNDGATIWARKTIESDIFYWKPSCWFKIWFYIITNVNHKVTKQFKRGEGFFNWSEIVREKRLGGDVTYSSIDHCIRWLKSAGMLATQKMTRGMLVIVLNYNLYQTLDTYTSDTKSGTVGETEAKQKRNRSETIYIYKNDKNDKNDKNKNKTSKNSITPCTEEELKELSILLGISLDSVKRTHQIILNKIETKEFKNKTVYKTLENWLLMGIERGTIKKKITNSILNNYKLMNPKNESNTNTG